MNSPLKQTFFSHGKLLLTGEYVVLDGALALAIPTKMGQSLTITETNTETISWNSFNSDNKKWFSAIFKTEDFTSTDTSETATTLSKILQTAQDLNPEFLKHSQGLEVNTYLEFPRDWGLGSSSTLLNNIAQWASVDAYKLLTLSFGGSGYDVAVAKHQSPILYSVKNHIPESRPIHLDWDFKDALFFVHLNKKQNSRDGIKKYREASVSEKILETISDYSKKLLLCYSLKDFEALLNAHERAISKILLIPTIKQQLFPDYPNTIKSLGAWGGDFILVTGSYKEMDYFKKKGYATIVPYSEMIL